MNPILENTKLHVEVFTKGTCPNCGRQSQWKIFDYGTMLYRELDRKLDEISHSIDSQHCQKCNYLFPPTELLYFDRISRQLIVQGKINYGDMTDQEDFLPMKEGHLQRREVFHKHEEDFWEGYCLYAIENWREIVSDLSKDEITNAYSVLEIEFPISIRTVAQARKDVLNRLKTKEEKKQFWRTANHYFIYDHMLDLGPLSWYVEDDLKKFGILRTRYVILHFPIAETLEGHRTKLIGKIVNRGKKDNDFLFRRISQLTDEMQRVAKRGTDFFHQNQKLKAELAKTQDRLGEAYAQLRSDGESKAVYERDPNDIRKIRELKGLVSELLAELKELRKIEPDEIEPVTIDEVPLPTEEKLDWDPTYLQGKKVGIIGGIRAGSPAQTIFGCELITHDGRKQDVDFHALLSKSDIIVVLTRFISHSSMWEAKAYAVENDKPIHFEQAVNLERILFNIAKNP